MKQFKNTFSIELPLLCGMMSQWPYKICVSLVPKLHVLPNLGFVEGVCKLSPLTNSCCSKPPTNTNLLGIEVNELNLVMTRLGVQQCESEGPLDDDDEGQMYNKMLSMGEIEGLFAEEEPSFGEIKQAFDVFDRNGDGFIDAFELYGVLSSLGVLKSTELDVDVDVDVDVCARILGGFDQKGVGLVDIRDFVRLLEKGLA